MVRLLSVLVVSMLLVAGCGSSGSSYSNATDVSQAAGFSACTADTNVMSTDAVDCDQGRVNWFKSSDALNGWRKIADVAASSGLGGSEILYGSDWAIECSSVATCSAAKSKIGGTIG